MIEDTDRPEWGSDVVAEVLRATGAPYLALNPGASFRGLHDSLVNHLGNADPQMILCLHEEHAVAIAHGYAKVTGVPMLVALHSNVGLMHAAMAIYNAWCDRVPMLIVGATGPLDAQRRRPWIDWIHTSADQASIVRPYVKWDDQPGSVEAIADSLVRAWEVTRTAPCGPTYVVLDAALQEQRLADPVPVPTFTKTYQDVPSASTSSLQRAARLLSRAERPVVLAGRIGRDEPEWKHRIELGETLGARVITDLKAGAAFPTEHPAHVRGPGFFLSPSARAVLAEADVVLALDWIDLAGTLAQAPPHGPRAVVNATLDHQLLNGWSKDGGARAEVDVLLPTTAGRATEQLLEELTSDANATRSTPQGWREEPTSADGALVTPDPADDSAPPAAGLQLADLAAELRAVLTNVPTSLARLPLGWDGDWWSFDHPLDYLGYDGGGGIGSGPGMVVGAALALRDDERLPVAVLGDGDFLMGVQAWWTAAHDKIPLLAVVANNRTYFNDEVHQEKVAITRDRDASKKWVGQRIDEPAPDLAGLARAQGLEAFGPVTDVRQLREILPRAVELARGGRPVVVDVVVQTGYSPAMASGLTREH
jgi:thiamine pyrophosphate-dependent acetolactate synthase large subunit-like protein